MIVEKIKNEIIVRFYRNYSEFNSFRFDDYRARILSYGCLVFNSNSIQILPTKDEFFYVSDFRIDDYKVIDDTKGFISVKDEAVGYSFVNGNKPFSPNIEYEDFSDGI